MIAGCPMFTRRSAPVAVFVFSIACIRGQTPAVDFDRIAREVIAQQRVVGASVLVARGDKIVFEKGYGFADLGLQAPTKPRTWELRRTVIHGCAEYSASSEAMAGSSEASSTRINR